MGELYKVRVLSRQPTSLLCPHYSGESIKAPPHLSHTLPDDLDNRPLRSPLKLLQLFLHTSLQVPVDLLRGDVQIIFILSILGKESGFQYSTAFSLGFTKYIDRIA